MTLRMRYLVWTTKRACVNRRNASADCICINQPLGTFYTALHNDFQADSALSFLSEPSIPKIIRY